MRIAIEGMDGVGKTTVAKMLCDKLGYKYVTKPFTFLFENLNLSESQIKDLEWKLYETKDEALISTFYGLGLLYGTRCDKEQNIVYDRHFVSNYYWHGNSETDQLHKEFIKLCGEPDLTVLLKARTDTRMKRIYERDHNDRDLSNKAMYADGYDKMEKFLKDKNFKYITINTEHMKPNEITELIEKKIEEINENKDVKFDTLKKGDKITFNVNNEKVDSEYIGRFDYAYLFNTGIVTMPYTAVHNKQTAIVINIDLLNKYGFKLEEAKAILYHELGHTISIKQKKLSGLESEYDADKYAIQKTNKQNVIAALKKTEDVIAGESKKERVSDLTEKIEKRIHVAEEYEDEKVER